MLRLTIFILLALSATAFAQTKNLAFDQPAPTIPPRLTEHSRKMVRRIYPAGPDVYVAVGYGIANSTMIVGTDGVIIVDTMESVTAATPVAAEFRKITNKPVKAVIYTHNHTDHISGVKAFVSEQDVATGNVAIIAHESLMDTVAMNASVVAPILGLRSLYSFGAAIETGPTGTVNQGLGPMLVRGAGSFIAPTRTFRDALDLEIAGVHLELRHAPSETDDEIVVWLPDRKVLQSAEVIQGETFPNLHTLRGTRYRDPVNWYKTIDMLRRYPSEYLAPSHGRPVAGRDTIEDLLRSYRDAIQYVHDQTIRNMNRGLTPDELVEVVAHLPPHLAGHPWLGEFYGTVKHSVRQIYQGYLGWFDGDPADLDPLPRPERSSRYVAMMGGRDKVLNAARESCDAGDHRWCAELTTHLIRVNTRDAEARKLKAEAFRQLGYRTENTNWRNFYLTAARELDGTLPEFVVMSMRSLASPDILRSLPPERALESLAVRLDPIKSANAHITVAFQLTDLNRTLALEVRRGIAQVHETAPAHVDTTLTLTRAELDRAELGAGRAAGDAAALKTFWSYFDRPLAVAPALSAR